MLMKSRIDRRLLLEAGAASLMLAGTAWAQQVPIPTTAAQVPGPPSGTAMTTAYVQTMGRTAYLWGWALVNNANRHADFSKAPEPGLIGGVVPIAHNAVAMLTGYISATQRIIACANQDVAYGAGFLDNLDNAPIVFQVPDFGDRFWVYALYDARTDQLSNIGKQYGTKPGFYMVVGPNWRGGRGRRRRKLRRCCDLPRRWSSPSHAYSWTTRRRITPPSNRCSVRSFSTRSRASTGK